MFLPPQQRPGAAAAKAPDSSLPKGFEVPIDYIPAAKGFNMLLGMKDIKTALRRRFIDTMGSTMNLVTPSPQTFLLLYGPPGTGKTSIAKAIGGEIAALMDAKEKYETGSKPSKPAAVPFINFDPQAALGRLVGDSEKQVGAIFEAARNMVVANEKTIVIIFMDEAESLMMSRSLSTSETGGTVKTSVLMKMTSLSDFNEEREAEGKSGRVLFVAATNYPNRLDDAFLRRFEKRVFVDLPDVESRKDQIRLGLMDSPFNLNLSALELECLGHMTQLFSQSDIKQTLKNAQSLLPDLSLNSSAFFRINERGKLEIVPLVDPELPPCASCRRIYEDYCPVCKSVYMKVIKIPVAQLETTVFITIADVVDLFARQRPSLNQETYEMMKSWHATRGTPVA